MEAKRPLSVGFLGAGVAAARAKARQTAMKSGEA
jgi:hypothetical protein